MNADEVKQSLATRAEEFVRYLFPAGRKSGKEWLVGSLTGEGGKSMARSVQAERWADELVTLSDSPPENATAEQVAVVKLQADTRKWIIGKRLPKKYGDAPVTSVNVSQTNNAWVLTVERQRALQETWRKLKELEG